MKNRDFFQQFVTEDFNRYIERKRVDSEHGNHVELQAISEMYNRPIEIYIYDSEPSNVFQSSYRTDDLPIRLSYHNNIHYNSVYDPYSASVGVGLGLPSFTPGVKRLFTSLFILVLYNKLTFFYLTSHICVFNFNSQFSCSICV